MGSVKNSDNELQNAGRQDNSKFGAKAIWFYLYTDYL
jgi:hypothetical protein